MMPDWIRKRMVKEGKLKQSPQSNMSWKGLPTTNRLASYKVGDKTFFPGRMDNMGDYTNICRFLSTLKDVRCHVCWKCSVSKVYDKNNKEYKVSRGMTLESVKELVEEIRKINAA